MASESDFDLYVGKIMKACQCIEHDIKLIYCGMREDANGDDFDSVYDSISKITLGQILKRLYKIDHTYMHPFFSESDYKILNKITSVRNHWAHQGYIDWVYTNAKFSFSQKWQQLKKDFDEILPLSEQTEKIRLQFFGINTDEDD